MPENEKFVADFDQQYVIQALEETLEDIQKKRDYYKGKLESVELKIKHLVENIEKLKNSTTKQKRL